MNIFPDSKSFFWAVLANLVAAALLQIYSTEFFGHNLTLPLWVWVSSIAMTSVVTIMIVNILKRSA